MENDEALELLANEIAKYCVKSYAELAALVGDEDHPAHEIAGPNGEQYWIEIEAFWDGPDQSCNGVRLRGAICGGSIDYQVPICDDFLKASDGSFVDE